MKGRLYGTANKFLSVQDYKHLTRWTESIEGRPAAKRAIMVNKVSGEPHEQVRERHSAADFDGKG